MPKTYPDGRPSAALRMDAVDEGIVFKHGHGPDGCDAVRVYWSKGPTCWNPLDKAVVLDGANCSWSRHCIGMPSVIPVGDRLAVFYDAPGGDSVPPMHRDIGLAWLPLPLNPPDGNQPVSE